MSLAQIDGKFLKTLRYLVVRPGYLTKEYMEGRKVRYLRPITITTLLAGLFFLVLESNTTEIPDSFSDLGIKEADTITLNMGPGMALELTPNDLAMLRESTYDERVQLLREKSTVELRATQVFFGERTLRLVADGGLSRFQQAMFRMASRALIVLIPAFAWLVLILQWSWKKDRRPFYSEAVVYSLHVHSFFIVLLSIGQAPAGDWWTIAMIFGAVPVTIWYLVVSQRVAFQGSWLASIVRSLCLLGLHTLIIFLATVTISLIALALL